MHNSASKATCVITEPAQVASLITAIEKYVEDIICVGIGCKYKSLESYCINHRWYGYTNAAVIHKKDTKLEITTKYGTRFGKVCTYVFDLNGDAITATPGLQMFAQFQKAYKIPVISRSPQEPGGLYIEDFYDDNFDTDTGCFWRSAAPILGYKYDRMQYDNVYEYDLNSAYAAVILNGIPDFNQPTVGLNPVFDNEIGFIFDDNFTMITPGSCAKAEIKFPMLPCPDGLRQYINKWYQIKKQASKAGNDQLKTQAKAHLNYPVGYFQRKNPLFRAFVVHSCNNRIKSLMDENTIMWNTDAIFSTTCRNDLALGDDIGQFKVEQIGQFRSIGNNYQINDDIPKYRGINKNWFRHFEEINGRKFDIMTDTVPERMNRYEFNWNTMKLEENIYVDE